MVDESSKQQILDATDVLDVLSDFLDLKKRGGVYVCNCPFHSEKSPSFTVNPKRNRWHCFGCGKDGDAVSFLMEHQHLSFPEALLWLAKRYHIEVKKVAGELSETERAERLRRQSAVAALAEAQAFFVDQLLADSAEAEAARSYAYARWGESFCKEVGIGYAPKGNAMLEWAKLKGLAQDILFDLGLFRKSEAGKDYVLLRERITIPIRDRWGKAIAFTARYIGSDPDKPKYMNSPSSFLFSKEETLFGLDVAAREVRQSKCFIVVEGAPDVLRLQSIGLAETVAPLGTALTTKHLEQMKRLCQTVRFIPDSDPPKGMLWGAGVTAVMKHGAEAIRLGLDAYVREIPRSADDDLNGVKRDPDSYILSRQAYSELTDKHFLVWLGEKRFSSDNTVDANLEAMREIAELLMMISDEMVRDMCIDSLSKLFGRPKQWREAIRRESKKASEKRNEDDANEQFSSKEIALLRKFGIIVKNNMYYGANKEGELERWSNFIMTPHFHVKRKNALRKFTLTNEYGETITLAISQGKFSSAQSFQVEVESLGNFVWLAKQDKLNRLKEFLYAITDSLSVIKVLGWQDKRNFYAFADGLHDGERFYPIDNQGMVDYGGDKYYLPAYDESVTYDEDEPGYDFEKKIAYCADNDDSLNDFVQRMIDVFGDGAKVGFAWALACLFRDHLYKKFDWFPIFNLFGIPGSGKSALASILNSFFYPLKNDPPKLGNTSIPAISYMLDHLNDGIIVLDEYTNLLNDKTIDLLKGLWGGTTNTRKNMADTDKGISAGKVFSGVILCGQHLPTKDSALLTRCIHYTYFRNSFSDEENLAFSRLKEAAKKGNAHHMMAVMRHRADFVRNFFPAYEMTRREVRNRFKGENINDRILDNWVVILATFRVLETYIEVPFSYANLFEICVDGIRHQNKEAQKTSETSDFWEMVNALCMSGKIFYDSHFSIVTQSSFTPQKGCKRKIDFPSPRKLLYLNWPMLKELLRLRPGLNQMKMDLQALDNYLRNCQQFLGSRQRRFVRLNAQGSPDVTYEDNVRKRPKSTTWAMVFDYDLLRHATNIDLESVNVFESDDIDDVDEDVAAPVSVPTTPQQQPNSSKNEELLF